MKNLIDYTLHLADDALILGHRNSEWCGHGPILEQDIAITNIALDLIGQARNFYQYAAQLINGSSRLKEEATEDTLAYLRDSHEFKNCLLVEQPNGDWAKTILRQFFFSTYQYFLYEELQKSKDSQLAAIAEKSSKEVVYHLQWSSEWMIRLGDGTEESHQRMVKAMDQLWMFTEEMFAATSYELQAVNDETGVDLTLLYSKWEKKVKEIFREATLPYPNKVSTQSGGKEGNHSNYLSDILGELQFMQRAYPNSEW
jgi:ring-1,2-phenylacetyl-CoA epoxidase subunit PaaC